MRPRRKGRRGERTEWKRAYGPRGKDEVGEKRKDEAKNQRKTKGKKMDFKLIEVKHLYR